MSIRRSSREEEAAAASKSSTHPPRGRRMNPPAVVKLERHQHHTSEHRTSIKHGIRGSIPFHSTSPLLLTTVYSVQTTGYFHFPSFLSHPTTAVHFPFLFLFLSHPIPSHMIRRPPGRRGDSQTEAKDRETTERRRR